MAPIGYARVSTGEQDLAPRLDVLRGAGCSEVLEEHASGASRTRPQLAAALARVRRGDTPVAARIDRLARSLAHLLEVVEALRARGAHFRNPADPIDTAGPSGVLVLQMPPIRPPAARDPMASGPSLLPRESPRPHPAHVPQAGLRAMTPGTVSIGATPPSPAHPPCAPRPAMARGRRRHGIAGRGGQRRSPVRSASAAIRQSHANPPCVTRPKRRDGPDHGASRRAGDRRPGLGP